MVYEVLRTEEEFKDFMLKKYNVEVDSYSYKEDMDIDYLSTHPWILRYRQYYENPNLWRLVLDKNIEPAIDFLMKDTRVSSNNLALCNSCLYSDRNEPIELCKRHLSSLTDEQEKIQDLNNFLWIIVQQNKVDKLKKMIEYAKEQHIEPVHKNWANIAYGDAMSESVKFDDPSMFNYLITMEPDPTLNDSMPFCIACKYAHYKQALDLVKLGYDIHTMRDLGLKMINRNSSMVDKLSKENKKALMELLKMYDKK